LKKLIRQLQWWTLPNVPKIISDIQLVPPRMTSSHEPIPELSREPQEDREPFSDFEAWTEVVKKKNKQRQMRIASNDSIEGPAGAVARVPVADKSGGRPPPPSVPVGVRKRAPRNAAVSIKVNSDGPSYADIIKQARESINLKDIGLVYIVKTLIRILSLVRTNALVRVRLHRTY